MSKSILSSLKLTTKPEVVKADPIITRRNKLITRLQEQREMAQYFLQGKPYLGAEKQKVTVNEETGEATTETVHKRVKAWFSGSSDAMLLEVRYGNVPIELAAGKSAIEVGKSTRLLATIDTVIEAVNAGEMDVLLRAFDKPEKAKAAAE